jgi:hypothetical protein
MTSSWHLALPVVVVFASRLAAMLGLPASPGAVGGALLALGVVVVAVAWVVIRRRYRPTLLDGAFIACLAVTVCVAPFLVWRIVEDTRYTTGLNASDRDGAGPIQAYLAPYLLDRVPAIVPRNATYAAVVGDRVSQATARKAFPSLAQNVLFPRVAVRDPRDADWVVAWGVDPRRVAPVEHVVVARPAFATSPTLYVARVRR